MLKQVSLRLEEELVKRIKKICIDKGITFQEAVRTSLEKMDKDNESG